MNLLLFFSEVKLTCIEIIGWSCHFLLRGDRWQLEIALSTLLLFLVLREVAHYLPQVAQSVLGPIGLVMIQPTGDIFHLIGTEVLGQRVRRPAPT